MDERKEINTPECRPGETFNQKPTGHRVPTGRSDDDPDMAFKVPDCAYKAGGEFMHPVVLDERDLPTDDESKRNKQGF